MKNLLKSTVAMPFKFLKGMLDMMKEILSAILKLFGHPGLKTGGAHTSKADHPNEQIKQDDLNKKTEPTDKPTLEQAHKVVSDQALETVKKIIAAKERDPADVATLSKNMKIYVAGLTADKMAALSKMTDDQMRLQIYDDLERLKQRQTQMMKHVPTKDTAKPEDDDNANNEKLTALKKRIQQRKMNSAPTPKMAFAL